MDFRTSSPTPSFTARPLQPTPRPSAFGTASSLHRQSTSSPSLSSVGRESRFNAHEHDFDMPGFSSMSNHSSSNLAFPPSSLHADSRDDGLGFRAFSTPELPPEDEHEYAYPPPKSSYRRSMSTSGSSSFTLPKPKGALGKWKGSHLQFARSQQPITGISRAADDDVLDSPHYRTPRWILLTRFSLRVLAASGSLLVVGLLAASVQQYNTTRSRHAIHSQDEDFSPAWPASTSLVPSALLLTAALLNLFQAAGALAMGALMPRLRLLVQSGDRLGWMGAREHYAFVATGAVMALVWVLALVAFIVGGGVDSLADVACREQGSLSSLIVNFGGICAEQFAAWYFSIALFIVECFMLASYGISYGLWKRSTKLSETVELGA